MKKKGFSGKVFLIYPFLFSCFLISLVLATGGILWEADFLEPDASFYSQFGRRVSNFNDRVVVSANDQAFVYTFVSGTWQVQELEREPENPPVGSFRYGFDVAIEDDLIVVGHRGYPNNYDHPAPTNSGAAYVFRYQSASQTWQQEGPPLHPDGLAFQDFFGSSVDVSGNLIVVGATEPTQPQGGSPGSAYVFEYEGGVWVHKDTLLASDGEGNDGFGVSVGIAGNTIVVGAYGEDDYGNLAGAAYVFEYNPGTGQATEIHKLTASDLDSYDSFGLASAISDTEDRIVISAYQKTNSRGAVYIFDRNGTQWGVDNPEGDTRNENHKLTASNGHFQDRFGVSVATQGDFVVVGASNYGNLGDDPNYPTGGQGASYVFQQEGDQWHEILILQPSDPQVGDPQEDGTLHKGGNFGADVSLFGLQALVGASLWDSPQEIDSGKVYLFNLDDEPGPPPPTPTPPPPYEPLVVVRNPSSLSECIDGTLPPEPVDVCQIYVPFDDDNDILLSVGNANVSVFDSSGIPRFFFQAEMGGDTAPPETFFQDYPDLVCDSFVAIGWASVPEGATDATAMDPDFDSEAFNDPLLGGLVGGWFSSNPPAGQGVAGNYPNNQVLIAQLSIPPGTRIEGELTVFWQEVPGGVVFGNPISFQCGSSNECLANFNGDDVVDSLDLGQLIGAWSIPPGSAGCDGNPSCPQDLNGDTLVDALDLGILIGAWGPCP